MRNIIFSLERKSKVPACGVEKKKQDQKTRCYKSASLCFLVSPPPVILLLSSASFSSSARSRPLNTAAVLLTYISRIRRYNVLPSTQFSSIATRNFGPGLGKQIQSEYKRKKMTRTKNIYFCKYIYIYFALMRVTKNESPFFRLKMKGKDEEFKEKVVFEFF